MDCTICGELMCSCIECYNPNAFSGWYKINGVCLTCQRLINVRTGEVVDYDNEHPDLIKAPDIEVANIMRNKAEEWHEDSRKISR